MFDVDVMSEFELCDMLVDLWSFNPAKYETMYSAVYYGGLRC